MEALACEPSYACAWWLRGKLCLDRGAVSESGSFMCQAITLDPIHALAWLSLSHKYELSGQLDTVLIALRSCMSRLRSTHSLQTWHTSVFKQIAQQRKHTYARGTQFPNP